MFTICNKAMTVKISQSGDSFTAVCGKRRYLAEGAYYETATGERHMFSNFTPKIKESHDQKSIRFDYGWFVATVSLPGEEPELNFEIIGTETSDHIKAICWPGAIRREFSPSGATVLPIMQGMLLRDTEKKAYNIMEGQFYTREGTMPWWGQYDEDSAYFARVITPFDAQYRYCHDIGTATSVSIHWIPSLGSFRTSRRMQIRFFDTPCDYVVFARHYRALLEREGEIVTLKQKAEKNPTLERLIGSPVYNGPLIYYQIEPESSYYNHENKEKNTALVTFDKACDMIRAQKAKGVEKAYIHIDGWGLGGYDNLCPRVLPPCPKAGGTEGLRRVKETCRELDYLLAYHDQYRDFYYISPDFDPQKAVTHEGGSITSKEEIVWYGGKEAQLCAKEALAFVKRNYGQMQEEGICPDGAYLDVFSASNLDECFHEKHRMTREECAKARGACFDFIRENQMIVSSEEIMGCFVKHLDLVHHSPYINAFFDFYKREPFGINIPLLNLVFHDCILTPWATCGDVWGLPPKESGFLHCMLTAGLPAVNFELTDIGVERVKILGAVNTALARAQMVSHKLLDDQGVRQQAVYDDGTEITINLAQRCYRIEWPDHTISEGEEPQ